MYLFAGYHENGTTDQLHSQTMVPSSTNGDGPSHSRDVEHGEPPTASEKLKIKQALFQFRVLYTKFCNIYYGCSDAGDRCLQKVEHCADLGKLKSSIHLTVQSQCLRVVPTAERRSGYSREEVRLQQRGGQATAERSQATAERRSGYSREESGYSREESGYSREESGYSREESSGWKQAGLSPSRGALGLRSVAAHSPAAYLQGPN
ncbi:hypothetical protein EMCRGX_G029345 [Ephydatia muelleri]